jgi:hypothetical protein
VTAAEQREMDFAYERRMERVRQAHVGDRLWFRGEKRPYTIQARNERFLVCNKPFAARHTTIYTIVDLEENVRGPENLIFGAGAETREQCEEMLVRLTTGIDNEFHDEPYTTEISYRNRVTLDIMRFESKVTK